MEWPAKRCCIDLVAVGVQEQAEDILVPPLLRNCLTLNNMFPQSLSPLQNSDPCDSFHRLGHSENVYDDDDDDDDEGMEAEGLGPQIFWPSTARALERRAEW